MKVINRINTADANSQYINNVISSLSETHPAGLTVIQYISDITAAENFSKPVTDGISNTNTVLAADKPEIYEILKRQMDDDTTSVFGTVEDAKVYIKYSHVLIIDGNLSVNFSGNIPDFSNNKIYLIDIADNDSLDAKIYKKFLTDNHIDEYSFESHTIEKLIRETNCIIPSHLIFHHSFSDNFSFRFNIWMSNLMAIVNLSGEIVKTDGICVNGELKRGIPENYKDTLACIKYIDSKITKRFDEDVSEVLKYFNKIFTANLKNPYLASKYSDYVSSGTKIWSLYEQGSVLSEIVKNDDNNVFGSELGHIEEIEETLFKLVDIELVNENKKIES